MRAHLLFGCLALLLACGKKQAEAPLPSLTASAPAAVQPWSWHPLGGLAVIEGEVTEPTDLTLKGRSIEEHRFAEPGPVRWEFYRPPEGETAVLLDGAGRQLAQFLFTLHPVTAPAATNLRVSTPRPSAPAPKPRPAPNTPPVPKPPPTPQAKPVAPKAAWVVQPAPEPRPAEPPAAQAKTMARMDTRPVGPFGTRNRPSVQPTPKQVPPFVSQPVPIPEVLAMPEPHPEPLPVPPPSRLLNAWPGAGEGLNLTRGRTGHKQLLLSFDGGSNAEVATEVLDLLKARGVRTTFFLTGSFIQHFPDVVRRMAAEGHELGNHTMNHPHFAPGMRRDPRWTRERIQKELLDADEALVKLLGRPMDPVWRAPYGEQTAEIRRWAEELGYRHVGWSEGADTLDWATPKERRLYRSGDAIVKRLEQRLNKDGDGLIVLMHLGSERAVGDRPTKGLGAFMDRALEAGWTFVPVSAFIRDLGKPTWDGRRRLALLVAPPKGLPEKTHPAKAQAAATLHP